MKRMVMTVLAAALMTAGLAGAAEAQHRGGGSFHGSGGFHGGGFHGGGFHGGGWRGGFYFGAPVYDPFWYGPSWGFSYPYYDSAYYSPYPYYYSPYTDYPPAAAPAAPPSQGYYYCNSPQGYYPSVPSCNTQWQYVPSRQPS